MTRESLEKLSVAQRARIEVYRELYKEAKDSEERAYARHCSKAYTAALLDSNILTKREANEVFIYTTV